MISDYEDSDGDDDQDHQQVKGNVKVNAARNAGAAQSMHQLPVTKPPERAIRKTKSAPMGQLKTMPVGGPNHVYPNQGLSPPPQYMYPPPQYNPYAAPNPYYQMQQPTVIIRRNAPTMPNYQDYDSNFEGYFGPDVRPTHHSALELQREQMQNFERNAPHRYYNNRQHASTPSASVLNAEERALEEAIQASLLESNRRAPRAREGSFGFGTGELDSGVTSLAASSKSHHWSEEILGENVDPAALADEKALQEAILLSLAVDSSSFDEAHSPVRPAASTTHQTREPALRPSAWTEPVFEPEVLVDRQYPYNLSPQLRRESSFHLSATPQQATRSRDDGNNGSKHYRPRKEVAPLEFLSPRTAESVIMSPRTDDELDRMDPRDLRDRMYSGRIVSPRDEYEPQVQGHPNHGGGRPGHLMKKELSERTNSTFSSGTTFHPAGRNLSPRDDYEPQEQGYPRHGGGRPVHLMKKDLSERTNSTFSSGSTFHPADPRNRSTSAGRGPLPPPQMLSGRSGRDPYEVDYPQVSYRSASPQKHHRRHRDFDHYPREVVEESQRIEVQHEVAGGHRHASPQRTMRPPAPSHDHASPALERDSRHRRDAQDAYKPTPQSDPVDRRRMQRPVDYAPPDPPQFHRSTSAPRFGDRDRAPPTRYPQYAEPRRMY